MHGFCKGLLQEKNVSLTSQCMYVAVTNISGKSCPLWDGTFWYRELKLYVHKTFLRFVHCCKWVYTRSQEIELIREMVTDPRSIRGPFHMKLFKKFFRTFFQIFFPITFLGSVRM